MMGKFLKIILSDSKGILYGGKLGQEASQVPAIGDHTQLDGHASPSRLWAP